MRTVCNEDKRRSKIRRQKINLGWSTLPIRIQHQTRWIGYIGQRAWKLILHGLKLISYLERNSIKHHNDIVQYIGEWFEQLAKVAITPIDILYWYALEIFVYYDNIQLLKKKDKVYFKSQILVHEYWTILDHFCIAVLWASEQHQHVLKM